MMVRAWVLAAALAAGACGGSAPTGTTTPVVYQEPPAPQVENVIDRPGYFWIGGRWDWRNNAWAWLDGHWEKLRPGFQWQPGAWERRGESWHWIDGRWAPSDDAQPPTSEAGGTADAGSLGAPVSAGDDKAAVATVAMYPTSAPPAPRDEPARGKVAVGSVFVPGRWDWKAGDWVWRDGHAEPRRRGEMFTPGRWELQGTYYVWIEGGWRPVTR